MNEGEKARLIKSWIALAHAGEDSSEHAANFWAHSTLWDLNFEDPELCWGLILRILQTDNSDAVIKQLSAGPLEDLLAQRGEQFIERLESEAQHNPSLRKLLGGLWQGEMSEEIWVRIQAARDQGGPTVG
ncbi:MAG: DUF6869 domain-containing protein [Acidiferrobacterales bacterium]